MCAYKYQVVATYGLVWLSLWEDGPRAMPSQLPPFPHSSALGQNCCYYKQTGLHPSSYMTGPWGIIVMDRIKKICCFLMRRQLDITSPALPTTHRQPCIIYYISARFPRHLTLPIHTPAGDAAGVGEDGLGEGESGDVGQVRIWDHLQVAHQVPEQHFKTLKQNTYMTPPPFCPPPLSSKKFEQGSCQKYPT